SMYSQIPAYMTERFPTEVRATASAFCYHVGAIFGGLVAPVLTWFAVDQHLGFAVPMMVCACVAIICYIASLLAWPARVSLQKRGWETTHRPRLAHRIAR